MINRINILSIFVKSIIFKVTIAIKKLKENTISKKRLQEFIEEVEIFKNLRPHPNTVFFYGACTSP